MIQSMTGFAAASAETSRGRLALELRSVNSRFLDLQFRVAEELRSCEPALRDAIAARIARGKIDCRVFFASGTPAAVAALEPRALESLAQLAAQAQRAFPQAAPLRVADVLRWPGVLVPQAIDEERMRGDLAALCARALDELVAARAREGDKLARAIRQRIAEMRRRLEEVAPLVPQALAAHQEKLAQRLREALGSADEERIRAELAVFGMKIDVDEELTRLHAHLGEVERTLERGGAAGKRLDFLAQELNRETNTLASKSTVQRVSDCALELRLLVEQIREQVQNVE